jgi:hypothetical protein
MGRAPPEREERERRGRRGFKVTTVLGRMCLGKITISSNYAACPKKIK